jgi:hypothetical protein
MACRDPVPAGVSRPGLADVQAVTMRPSVLSQAELDRIADAARARSVYPRWIKIGLGALVVFEFACIAWVML